MFPKYKYNFFFSNFRKFQTSDFVVLGLPGNIKSLCDWLFKKHTKIIVTGLTPFSN